jgi:hypothetical protein
MEAMLGISLYSYFYLKQAKTLFFLLSLMFSLGEVAQIMHTCVSKCKINEKKNSLVLVTHTCNSTYSRGRAQEDHRLKPAWTNSS